jgi:hypothetical protein
MNAYFPCGSGALPQYDMLVKRGTDTHRIFRFKDSSGAYIDLAGYTVKFHAGSGTSAIDQTLPPLAALDPHFPGVSLHLTRVQSRTLPLGRLTRYSIEIWQPSGDQFVVVEGYLVGEQGDDNLD